MSSSSFGNTRRPMASMSQPLRLFGCCLVYHLPCFMLVHKGHLLCPIYGAASDPFSIIVSVSSFWLRHSPIKVMILPLSYCVPLRMHTPNPLLIYMSA